MNRKATLLLFLSLGINVLLGSMIVGQYLHPEPPRWFPQPDQEILSLLPEERQKEFTEAMGRLRDDGGQMQQKFTSMRAHALHLLKAEPFDKAAYRAQVEEMHTLRSGMMDHFAETITSMADHWSLEERKVLAKLLKRPPEGWKGAPCPEHQAGKASDEKTKPTN